MRVGLGWCVVLLCGLVACSSDGAEVAVPVVSSTPPAVASPSSGVVRAGLPAGVPAGVGVVSLSPSPSVVRSPSASASPQHSSTPKASASSSKQRRSKPASKKTSKGSSRARTKPSSSTVETSLGAKGEAEECSITVEGVRVQLAAKQTTVTVAKTRGTRATVTMVERVAGRKCGVRTVFRDRSGRIGYGGAVPASKRRQDTGTTPQGTFTVTEAFGLKADPGTRLLYRRPGKNSYWVLDSSSSAYNSWAEQGSVAFDASEGERLRDYPGQYNYVAVIDYNRWPARKGKGGAIFLHVHGKGATAGCVSISEANMKTFLRHVAAGDHITIR